MFFLLKKEYRGLAFAKKLTHFVTITLTVNKQR